MTASRFAVQGNTVWPIEAENSIVLDELEPRTYVLNFSPQKGFSFTVADDFKMPKKLYGTLENRAERILNTFELREGTTGVLLAGEKGSGKSLCMKKISLLGLERGYPTIIINDALCGTNFNKLIASIKQRCVIIIDEFEKIYSPGDQEMLLTLLDGAFKTDKLIVFTINALGRMNEHMINRPGRIYYNIKYSGLETQFIEEYCRDNLKDHKHIEKILMLTQMFEHFNFDMLQALCEELNRYGEDVKDVIRLLNVKPDMSYRSNYEVKVYDKKTKQFLKRDSFSPSSVTSPLMQEYIYFDVCVPTGDKLDNGEQQMEWRDIQINMSLSGDDLKISRDLNEIRIETETHTFVLEKYIKTRFDPTKLL